MLYSHMIIDN